MLRLLLPLLLLVVTACPAVPPPVEGGSRDGRRNNGGDEGEGEEGEGEEGEGEPGPEDSAGACSDDFDNDGDGFEDCADFDCESTGPCGPPERSDAACTDLVDNDRDGFADCLDSACASRAVCEGVEPPPPPPPPPPDGVLRVVSWNVQVLFDSKQPLATAQAGFDAVVTMLLRMDADVACLNEVQDIEEGTLRDLAEATGYAHVFQGNISTGMAGGLTNACLSNRPFLNARSRSSNDISSDVSANETGRDLTEVRVALTDDKAVTIISVHYKSGFEDADEFRRHIEAHRAGQLVSQIRAARPTDGVVLMGDMNYDVADGAGATFSDFPAGMPLSYQLGFDVQFPVQVDPFGAMTDAGLTITLPTHEDNLDDSTRIPSSRRIDYQLFGNLTLLADEVYDPCRDNNVDDGSPGGRMEKSGDRVPCGTAEVASDHWPVMADYAP